MTVPLCALNSNPFTEPVLKSNPAMHVLGEMWSGTNSAMTSIPEKV